MRRMIVRASSWVIWSATVRASSARKRQCAGSQLKFLAISLPRHLSPLTEKAPAIDGRGKLSRAGRHYEFGPSRSAPCRAEHSLVALTTSGDLFIYAKDLFVCAKQQQQ